MTEKASLASEGAIDAPMPVDQNKKVRDLTGSLDANGKRVSYAEAKRQVLGE